MGCGTRGLWERNTQYHVSRIMPRAAKDIELLTGIDLASGVHDYFPNTAEHTINRHGADGLADHSLADTEDMARAAYVLDNYDTIELGRERNSSYKNSDGTPAQTVIFRKAINGAYVIVEAVPDAKRKRTILISSWIEARKGSDQVPNVNNVLPEADVQNESGEPYAENIAPDDLNVKNLSSAYNSDNVNELNSIQRFAHEPVMPRGNEVSDVKVGDVKRLISEALGVPVREGQIRKKGLGGFISYNLYNGEKNEIVRIRARNANSTFLY